MKTKVLKYLSAGKDYKIHAKIWIPDNGEQIKGVVQIAHGMSEHIGRYEEFASFLTENNYIVCGNDHRSHGDSTNGTYGYFAEKDGYKLLIADMRKLHLIVKKKFPGAKCFLLGHSMGSFLARIYCTRFGNQLDGVLFSGTGNNGGEIKAAMLFCRLFKKVCGSKARGVLFSKALTKSNNHKIKRRKSQSDWLTRDDEIINRLSRDKKFGFMFSYGAYLDLFHMVSAVSNKKWAKSYPKALPTYIFSGDKDPIGNYGKAPKLVCERLLAENVGDVTLKLYKDGRHEMLNEINRQEVYSDILNWLKKH